jgi:hypothetical protein
MPYWWRETNGPATTYPHRPSVRQTSSDDAPLVVKSSDKLPSGMEPRESETEGLGKHKARPWPAL